MAFNNHSGSTKSYDYVREHNEALNRIDFIEGREEITTQYDPGTLTTVQQHDGSILRLRKLGEEYDPSDKIAAMKRVQESLASGEVVTGLLYVDPTPKDLHHHLNTVEAPAGSRARGHGTAGQRRSGDPGGARSRLRQRQRLQRHVPPRSGHLAQRLSAPGRDKPLFQVGDCCVAATVCHTETLT